MIFWGSLNKAVDASQYAFGNFSLIPYSLLSGTQGAYYATKCGTRAAKAAGYYTIGGPINPQFVLNAASSCLSLVSCGCCSFRQLHTAMHTTTFDGVLLHCSNCGYY
jgi:hypothetical protein